jgi:signal transduction histidine kinase
MHQPGTILAMEQQDLEEAVGNLLENASRFADTKVVITVMPGTYPSSDPDVTRRSWLTLLVEDDGPGLEPEQITEAMKRGRRLDESRPGTGLGLSIVSEVVSEYHGTFAMSRSPLGGLKAELLLPGLSKELA